MTPSAAALESYPYFTVARQLGVSLRMVYEVEEAIRHSIITKGIVPDWRNCQDSIDGEIMRQVLEAFLREGARRAAIKHDEFLKSLPRMESKPPDPPLYFEIGADRSSR